MTRNEAEWRAKEERKALGKEGGDMMQYGTRVKILAGGSEFVGKTGRVVGEENYGRQKLYRVRLDEPVIVEGVGRVTHDLWEKQYLRRTR